MFTYNSNTSVQDDQQSYVDTFLNDTFHKNILYPQVIIFYDKDGTVNSHFMDRIRIYNPDEIVKIPFVPLYDNNKFQHQLNNSVDCARFEGKKCSIFKMNAMIYP